MYGKSKFQSTLPRGERRNDCRLWYAGSDFNPRSREGSDKRHSRNMFETIDFNPRSREGSDLHRFRHVLVVVGISIHAPARGATFCHLLALLNTRNFNPRSREGSDGPSDVTLLTVPVFQSTLPRGERHLPQTRCPENVYFNPRSREGSDGFFGLFQILSSYFNPRSREGSDVRNLTQHSGRIFISIHAPARGATPLRRQP